MADSPDTKCIRPCLRYLKGAGNRPAYDCVQGLPVYVQPLIAMKNYLFLLVFSVLTVSPALAQDTPEPDVPEANPADVESVDAIVAAVYDVISGPAGEERDWNRFRSLFRPEARLIPARNQQDGSLSILFWGPEDYVARAGASLKTNGFFEKEIFRVQEGYGQIVHLFSTYESRRDADDEEPFARGINSFQLVNDGSRWWVVNIFWQGETPANVISEKYLPRA